MKKQKIGIVGLGTVGSACKFGFEKLGHTVVFHDIAYDTKLSDLLETSIIFISVPTPALEDGTCDVSIVQEVVWDLQELDYEGTIAIKSTVEPGTSRQLRDDTGMDVCFVPEFLRERCAVSDFVENHVLLAVGCTDEGTYREIVDLHGNYPKRCVRLGLTEAELLKYYSNVFNAMRVIFANEFYETCVAAGASYDDIKAAYIMMGMVPDQYLDVNEKFRGYGGVCLPKDVKALVQLQKKLGVDGGLFKSIDTENKKYKTTVFGGMRLK